MVMGENMVIDMSPPGVARFRHPVFVARFPNPVMTLCCFILRLRAFRARSVRVRKNKHASPDPEQIEISSQRPAPQP